MYFYDVNTNNSSTTVLHSNIWPIYPHRYIMLCNIDYGFLIPYSPRTDRVNSVLLEQDVVKLKLETSHLFSWPPCPHVQIANIQKWLLHSRYWPSNTVLVLFVMQSQRGAAESVVRAENCNSEGLHVGRRCLTTSFQWHSPQKGEPK